MKIDHNTLEKLAHLSRLEFSEAEKDLIMKDLNRILEWIDKLNDIDTSNIQPLENMSTNLNVMRNDVQQNTMTHTEGLKNAPKKDSDYFRVPKVIE